jgi:ABC-2 type transport system ATP-binding protein
MLKIEHISKSYDDLKAVDDLSFEVKPGEIFGLLGVNGAGKTTTFRMIVNLLDTETGRITLDGKPIDYTVSDKIGFLTEERSLFTKMFVDEQIMYYGRLKGMNKKEIEEKTDYWLNRLNMTEFKHKKIKELSKGNQQKLQFITSVINNPRLLILDEPFTSLDPFNVSLLVEVLKEMSDNGCIVIFSSHRMEHVELFCEELLILVRGKSILSGSLKQIKEDYRKKSIHVNGNINVNKIKNLKGVEDVEKTPEEYIIRIADKKYIDDVFNIVKEGKNIVRFNVEDPTLDEIFVSKVGEVYE